MSNPNFLRPDAQLLLVIIAAQDDGSPGEPLTYLQDIEQLKPVPDHIMASAVTHLPSARLQSFIDSFSSLGAMVSIDQESWADALSILASRSVRLQPRLCIEGVPLQPISCTLTLVENIGGPQEREIGTMPLCDPNGQPSGACGGVVQNPTLCPASQLEIVYCWNGFDPSNPSKPCPDGPNQPPYATVVVECAVECH